MLSTIQSLRLINGDYARTIKTTAARADVQRESKYYQTNITKIKTIDDFVKNSRVFGYAMKAFGMEDLSYAKAFVKKALVEGVDDDDSFANRLVDPRLREFVAAFNFERFGATATEKSSARQQTIDRYLRQTLEESAGEQNEGVRLALYFERKFANGQITSAFSILADTALSSVVRTALGIPAASATQDIDKQAALIDKKLKLNDLKDPKKLTAFLERFAVRWDIANPQALATSPATALFTQSPGSGFNASLLTAIQSLKLGGN